MSHGTSFIKRTIFSVPMLAYSDGLMTTMLPTCSAGTISWKRRGA
ncbi:hypothetical protein [Burkholderia sp. AU45251]|nr:hypothetical protein [Burkholderia sp. AU45251]MDN7515184.1 hypothetical protein [Burkholderia sp. AU45251]